MEKLTPYRQGAIAIGLGFIFMIGTIAFGAGGMEINPNTKVLPHG